MRRVCSFGVESGTASGRPTISALPFPLTHWDSPMKQPRLWIAIVLLIPLFFLFHRHTADTPTDAKDLLDKYEREVREIREKAEAAIAARRDKLIADLKALHETYVKGGKAE